jgi:reactive intermediate/imine deaminase
MSSTVTTHPSLQAVSTEHAPAAIGPYTQAFRAGELLFVSGCIPLDPKTVQVVSGGIEAQTEQALRNLKAVVEAGGSELGKVVKTLVGFLALFSFLSYIGCSFFFFCALVF